MSTSGYVPFTEYPDLAPTVGVAVLSFITSRRSLSLNPVSLASWRAYSWPRLVCLGVFTTSWCFLYAAGVLVLGIGMSQSKVSCSLGIFSCIIFYAISKIFIYLFLIEKVHIIGNTSLPRFKSKLYIACLVIMAPYVAVLILMIVGRIAEIKENGSCYIGLTKFASLSLLIYDLFLNVYLTSLFVWPILRSKFVNPKIRAVATRTMLSALMALTTSTVNILVLTLMKGRQLGFVCLGSCGADVTINACVLFYVTWSPSRAAERDVVNSGINNQKASQVTAIGARSHQKTANGGTRNPKVGLMPRSDYTQFPEPREELSIEIDPEDGGGYAIPREPAPTVSRNGGGGAILAREAAFSQKPFSMEDREKRRAKGRVNLGASEGGSFFTSVKRALGLTGGKTEQDGEKDVGMNSIQVHVNTEIATADFPPVRSPAVASHVDHELFEDLNQRNDDINATNGLAPAYDDRRSPFRTDGPSDRLDAIVHVLNHSDSEEGYDFDDESSKADKASGSKVNLQ